MIGESSGVSTLLTNERIYRESQETGERRDITQTTEEDYSGSNDEVRLSAEAVALARTVAPPTSSSEEVPIEAQERGQAQNESAAPQFLDIKV